MVLSSIFILCTEMMPVESRLVSNCGEFDIIKQRGIYLLPDVGSHIHSASAISSHKDN